MDQMIISMALAILLETIKNPTKKTTMKKAFLKVYQTIKTAYADDPDFQ